MEDSKPNIGNPKSEYEEKPKRKEINTKPIGGQPKGWYLLNISKVPF